LNGDVYTYNIPNYLSVLVRINHLVRKHILKYNTLQRDDKRISPNHVYKVIKDENIEFTCSSNTVPSWSYGSTIEESKFLTNHHNLQIKQVDLKHAGNYYCIGNNQNIPFLAILKLLVYRKFPQYITIFLSSQGCVT